MFQKHRNRENANEKHAIMVDVKVYAKTAKVVVYANMEEKNLNANTVEEVVYANI